MLILAIFSVIEVYSSIGKVAYDHDWNVYRAIGKHVFVILLSYACTIVLSNLNYGLYKGMARIFFYFIQFADNLLFFSFGNILGRFADHNDFGSSGSRATDTMSNISIRKSEKYSDWTRIIR